MAVTLNVRPRRIPGEPDAGYLMRAFAINGRPWSRDRFAKDGLAISAVVHGDAGAAIATYLGDPASPVAEDTARPTSDGRVALRGELLHREDWTSRRRRWCPACWTEDLARSAHGRHKHWNVHRRSWWDVTAVTGCPVHGTALATACPGCGEEVHWHHGSLTRCRCGHGLVACEAVALDDGHADGDAYIVGRLGGISRSDGGVLDAMSLDRAIAVMERLGTAAVDEGAGIAALRERVGRRRLLAEGHRVAVGLPASAPDLVDRVHATAPEGIRKWGMTHAYGDFHEWVRDLPEDALARPLRKAMADHARGRVTLKTGYSVAGVAAERITLLDAARSCGISHERFRRLACALGHIPVERRQGTPVELTPDAIVDVRGRLRDTIDLAGLAARFGVSTKAARQCVEAGLIAPTVARTGPSGPGTWLFRSDDADDVLERLAAAASREAPGVRVLPLPTAARTARASVAVLVRLVLDGDVASFASDAGTGTGLWAFGVAADGIRGGVRDARRDPAVSLRAFSIASGISLHAVEDYAAKGVLATVATGQGRLVAPEAREAFERTYVGVPELVAIAGRGNPRWIIATLAERGVAPACPRPRFVRVLFAREEAEGALRLWLGERRADPVPMPPGPGLTRNEVAGRLGLDKALVAHLIATGAIHSRRGGRARLVHPDEVDRFGREFVSAFELAGLLGKRGASAAHPILDAAGIAPAHWLPSGRYRLFPRDAALAAVLAHLRDGSTCPRTGRRALPQPTVIPASSSGRPPPGAGGIGDMDCVPRRDETTHRRAATPSRPARPAGRARVDRVGS